MKPTKRGQVAHMLPKRKAAASHARSLMLTITDLLIVYNDVYACKGQIYSFSILPPAPLTHREVPKDNPGTIYFVDPSWWMARMGEVHTYDVSPEGAMRKLIEKVRKQLKTKLLETQTNLENLRRVTKDVLNG